jgi:pimeloyl-ACP methyl ester carboxylesterase
MMSDFQSHYADVNGVQLHYVSVGTGKLVMFVHGFPEFWAEWENQLADIGTDYQALLTGNLEGLEEYVSPLIVRRIPDGSHWITHEQPELVNALIRDFLIF